MKNFLILLIFLTSCTEQIKYSKIPNKLELQILNTKDTIELLNLVSDLNDTFDLKAYKTNRISENRNVFELKSNDEFLTEVLGKEIIPIYFEQIDSSLNIDFKKVNHEHSQSIRGTKFEIKIDSNQINKK